MRFQDIHIGDWVRFRQWDDMVDEFGLDEFDEIPCSYGFVSEMAPLCGLDVKVVDKGGYPDGWVRVVDEHGHTVEEIIGDGFNYSVSADMLEPANGVIKEFIPFDSNELDTLFGGD